LASNSFLNCNDICTLLDPYCSSFNSCNCLNRGEHSSKSFFLKVVQTSDDPPQICIPPGGSPPSSSSTSSSPTPAPSCVSTYRSISGDTCISIEAQFGLSAGAIQQANSFVTCTDICTLLDPYYPSFSSCNCLNRGEHSSKSLFF
jgi:hypothetical protein